MTLRGAYCYDAPYALIMFALAALGSLAGLVLFLWQRNTRGIRFFAFTAGKVH
jgi:hypothetical protein